MKELDFPTDFPSKNKKRGERKAKFKILKEQAFKKAKEIFHISDEFTMTWAQRHVESLNCNCWMCKNPRKAFDGKNNAALTIQEKKQNEADKTFTET